MPVLAPVQLESIQVGGSVAAGVLKAAQQGLDTVDEFCGDRRHRPGCINGPEEGAGTIMGASQINDVGSAGQEDQDSHEQQESADVRVGGS